MAKIEKSKSKNRNRKTETEKSKSKNQNRKNMIIRKLFESQQPTNWRRLGERWNRNRKKEMERSKPKNDNRKMEIEKSKSISKNQNRKSEIEKSKSQNRNRKIEIENSKSKNGNRKIEIEKSESKNRSRKIELEKSKHGHLGMVPLKTPPWTFHAIAQLKTPMAGCLRAWCCSKPHHGRFKTPITPLHQTDLILIWACNGQILRTLKPTPWTFHAMSRYPNIFDQIFWSNQKF